METQETKTLKKVVDNSSYREKFQFLLASNDNIIVQRFFRINRFNEASLVSAELFYALDNAVEQIKKDLKSKTQMYLWYLYEPTKICGFKDIAETKYAGGEYEFENDDVIKPWETTFRFTFMMFDEETSTDKVIYEQVWDGSIYPKFIRNSVDLTNSVESNGQYKKKPETIWLNKGRKDLLVETIKSICEVTSTPDQNSGRNSINYTKFNEYSNDTHFASMPKSSREKYDVWDSSNIFNFDEFDEYTSTEKCAKRYYYNPLQVQKKSSKGKK